MQVQIQSLIEGARAARGTVVIIDVYRAFTTAAVAFDRGAEKIYLTAEPDEALRLREQGIGDLCMGEVDGVRPEGFDFGNSPYELSNADVAGKTLVQSTRSGTVGVAAAEQATSTYVCSLAIASPTAKVLLRDASAAVTIVAMGNKGVDRTDEDEVCALYLRNLLEGRQPDRAAVAAVASAGRDSLNFGDPDQPQFHPMDRDWALRVDYFPFAIRVVRERDLLVARAVRA